VRGVCGLCVPSCAPAPAVTHASIRKAILDTAGIGADDLLFFSHANEALASLPYMICLDRARRTVVLAVRGTASLSDAITDLALNPVRWRGRETRGGCACGFDRCERLFSTPSPFPPPFQVDVAQYVPPDVSTTLTGPALAHAGIVRAAEAVLASVDAMGVLDALLTGDRGALCAYASGLDDDARAELVAQASGPLASVASAAGVPPDRLAAACEAALPDTKGWRLVVTGHSLGAGTAALLALILKPRVPGVRCWAFSPPGCTVSAALIAYTRSFVTSIAAGKDVVTRVGAVNLNRLIDEMMVSLARSKYPKLKVFCGGWWRGKMAITPSITMISP
jgi:sn1-specific diacylglycerol lipase